MHNSDAISILNCASESPCFFSHGVHIFVFENELFQTQSSIGYESKNLLSKVDFFLRTRPPASDRNFPGDPDSQAEMSVRFRKGGFIVVTFLPL